MEWWWLGVHSLLFWLSFRHCVLGLGDVVTLPFPGPPGQSSESGKYFCPFPSCNEISLAPVGQQYCLSLPRLKLCQKESKESLQMELLAAAYSPLPSSAPQGRLFQISLFFVSAQWGFWKKRQENTTPPVFAAPGTSLSFVRAHSVSSNLPTTLAVLFLLVPGCMSSRSSVFTLISPRRCPTFPRFWTS